MRLCKLDDIEDGGSAGFVIETPDDGKRSVIAVRQADTVHAYVNSCPHIGAPLDFQPGQFLNRNRTHIMCSTHGALFQIEDGLCIAGPCTDKSLEPLTTKTTGTEVWLVF
ncbi:MAG: Rieske (2Fe-2S) protein [Rhodospirillales bacterium]|nr:Rieske (2Fe-2S) protein [Rhodospirillales bacterium]